MAKRKVTFSQVKTIPPSNYDLEALSLHRKDPLSPEDLKKPLVGLAYENMNISPVEGPGQFSVRGGIVDIWPERYQNPARVDFFGNRIESIHLFDPTHHQPLRTLEHIDIFRYTFTTSKMIRWPKETRDKFQHLLLSDIQPGDLVVHIDHGIGRFLRIEERNLEGKPRYYLIVEYAKGEKLYVPVQQIDRLSKYIGIKGYKPQLSFLGTSAWERTKEKVSEDMISTARDLLKLYAAREARTRPSYPADSSWQVELERSFPYELTPSQVKALQEIKDDLESSRPMDRLLVGDVGFGKTELALRAAFKVVQAGLQVVVLVPTTILAEQHYHTFKERLETFPVKVSVLSRVQSHTEQAKILTELADGEADIVISTHRVLSADVRLKRLGILIVDEEHRFGVLDKEKFKKLRTEVDILSLSATPIPRTLHLALTKLRDISLITDPPEGRLAVQNYIGPTDYDLIKRVIEEEVGRDGQVYYLHNRVQSIAGETERLRRLLPGVKLGYAHGQMDERDLDQVMRDFLEHRLDVLVCTTIIGSGLDIQNVNTVLVRDAHKLGLADLYQIRGRVGRGERPAYAYFFYPKGYVPKEDARDRLEALAESEALGSGFNLAEHDLQIRGAGNLLGVKQHGGVSMVGFELYLQLLQRATESLRLGSRPRDI